ncbi:unnamed protein product, partial [Musa textilis]
GGGGTGERCHHHGPNSPPHAAGEEAEHPEHLPGRYPRAQRLLRQQEGCDPGFSEGRRRDAEDPRGQHAPSRSPARVPPTASFATATAARRARVLHDVHLLPSPSCSSSDGMSRYASAEDLQLLDDADDSTEADAGAPNAIDMKAEEFIARFYEQMRLQRQESFDGSNQAAA